jgi:SNF2 family DNA or RNA helicase
MSKDMLTWLRNMSGEEEALAAPAIIAKLIRLQQITCGTPMFNEEGKIKLVDPSTKVDAAMEIIETNDSEQFVVFSQFKGPLRLLARRLEGESIKYSSFTGDEHHKVREAGKRRFMEGDSRVFLSTIATGGVGVDGLQYSSSNGIFIDRHWSPAINDQAIARLHRGGQRRTVNIYDIMASDTIDFSRMATIELKAQWVREMLGDTGPKSLVDEAISDALQIAFG